ncbi:MAG TPA: twin-arginine translocation signal domain-containing protein [Phycisphaerae bacterium]|nr:twin-arginine translocation signal domain-containing protein [Phycisphaerae bacterium]
MTDPLGVDRRGFLKTAAGAGGAALAAAAIARNSAAQSAPAGGGEGAATKEPFVGIQMGPHTMLDEGIEHALDLTRDTAAVNAVITYSHAYNGDLRKPLTSLAQDHGGARAAADNRNRNFPLIWVKPHERFYKDTTLRHQVVTPQQEYTDRDLFAEMVEPARKRGMKVYARVLESSAMRPVVANYDKVVTRDINGRSTATACWNHPEYIAFWAATAEDLFQSYDLDGFQFGAERMGPLMNVICPWNNEPPTCFCEHCKSRAEAAGIDAERARKGYEELFNYCQARMAAMPAGRGRGGAAVPTTKPGEGIFIGFLRIMIRYPEILSWQYQYRLGREALCAEMYKRIKAIKPAADVGWHVDHQPSSWDPIFRAEMSYEEMAPHTDFIKIIAYHSVLGPRIRDWYLARFQRTILGELSLESSLSLYYDIFGYNKATEPSLADLGRKGFTPQYVGDETRHSVASAGGKVKIYTGVGFDVPGSPADDPAVIEQAVLKSFEAGASGIVISREYEEMKVPHLKAVGTAVRGMAGKA